MILKSISRIMTLLILKMFLVYNFACMPGSRRTNGVSPVTAGSESRVLSVFAESGEDYTLVIQKNNNASQMPIKFTLRKKSGTCAFKEYDGKPHLCALDHDFSGDIAFSGYLTNNVSQIKGDLIWQGKKVGAIGPLNEIIPGKSDTTTMVVACTGPYSCCDLTLTKSAAKISFGASGVQCESVNGTVASNSSSSTQVTSSDTSKGKTAPTVNSNSTSKTTPTLGSNSTSISSSSIASSNKGSNTSSTSSLKATPKSNSPGNANSGLAKTLSRDIDKMDLDENRKAKMKHNLKRMETEALSEQQWCTIADAVIAQMNAEKNNASTSAYSKAILDNSISQLNGKCS